MNSVDITKYQKNLSDMQMQHARIEERKINLESQLQAAVQKLEELGYTPDDIPEVLSKMGAEIATLEQQLQDNLKQAEEILAQ
jgi:Holliday junction resolvasome RuvABC DNA-binding subunit